MQAFANPRLHPHSVGLKGLAAKCCGAANNSNPFSDMLNHQLTALESFLAPLLSALGTMHFCVVRRF